MDSEYIILVALMDRLPAVLVTHLEVNTSTRQLLFGSVSLGHTSNARHVTKNSIACTILTCWTTATASSLCIC